MSFFDLENELPRWLDEVIAEYPHIAEITTPSVIHTLDSLSRKSYHSVNTNKGNRANGGNSHEIWKYQDADKRTYGKYLEVWGTKDLLQFWIGLIVKKASGMNLYLWFPTKPDTALQQRLADIGLEEEKDKKRNEYSYSSTSENSPSTILTRYCEYGSLPLNQGDLQTLEDAVKKAVCNLLDALP
jgi:hypothetical protein